jgi:hypothetical protein
LDSDDDDHNDDKGKDNDDKGGGSSGGGGSGGGGSSGSSSFKGDFEAKSDKEKAKALMQLLMQDEALRVSLESDDQVRVCVSTAAYT